MTVGVMGLLEVSDGRKSVNKLAISEFGTDLNFYRISRYNTAGYSTLDRLQ